MAHVETVHVDVCNNCGDTHPVPVTTTHDYEFGCCDNEFQFVECPSCGLVWLQNRPAVSALPVIYSSEYATYSYDEYLGPLITRLRNRVQNSKVQSFAPFMGKGELLMDVGCGNGSLLRMIQKFGDSSWQLVGVDLADDSIAHLESMGITGVKERFEIMDWDGTPPSVIVMNQVLEHFEDPQKVVAKAFEILKPGGVLVIETPSMDGWDAKLFREHYWGGWHTPRHWHLFKEENLAQTLRRHGLEVTCVEYLLNPYAWLQSLRFYYQDKKGWLRFSKLFQVNVLPSLVLASMVDVLQKLVRTRTSNIRMIGRKPVGAGHSSD